MLYLVATPIGNLKDITLRALEVLRSADVIACEDARRTGQLLKHFGIHNAPSPQPEGGNKIDFPLPRQGESLPAGQAGAGVRGVKHLLSFHEHSGPGRVREIIALLKEGKTVALVSDGGMPLVSDPGFPLVREAIREGIRVEAIPGSTAITTALAVSGLPAERFTFCGFLPPKSAKRKKELKEISEIEHTLIFFESPHRLSASLGEMAEIFGDREAVVCRELTKKFEEIKRGTLKELVQEVKNKKILGEIVILIAGKGRKKVFR